MRKETKHKIIKWTGLAVTLAATAYVGYRYRYQIGDIFSKIKLNINNFRDAKAQLRNEVPNSRDSANSIRNATKNAASCVQNHANSVPRNTVKSNVKVYRSEEIPVEKEIVEKLYDAAKAITREVKKLTGVTPKIDVISNMASHPTSGELNVYTDNIPSNKMEEVQRICEKHMNMKATEVTDNSISF